MSRAQRASKALLLALASAGAVACSAAPSSESSASSSEDLFRPKCAWYESMECDGEGPKGQVLCSCVGDGPPAIDELALGQGTVYALGGTDIYTWGSAAHYARGDGSTVDVSEIQAPLAQSTTTLTRFPRAYAAYHLVAGNTGAAALLTSGSIVAWGTVAPGTDWKTPQAVPGLAPFAIPAGTDIPGLKTRITHGANHACAIDDNMNVWCWGANDKGQLGDGTTTTRASAAQISANGYQSGAYVPIGGFVAVAAGGDTTCALDSGGSLWCWGDGSNGALGQGSHGPGIQSPTPLWVNTGFGLPAPTWLQGGGSGTFCVGTPNALQPSELRCWGANDSGQAMAIANGFVDAPIKTGLVVTNAPRFAFGAHHTCVGGKLTATSTPGTVCFGDDSFGQLGNGSQSGPTYTAVSPTFDQFDLVAAGGNFSCGIPTIASQTGAYRFSYLKCWGQDDHGQLSTGVSLTSTPAPIPQPTDAFWYNY